MANEGKATFEKLSKVHTLPFEEKKGNLTYLSWANAWALVKQTEPEASFRVITFDLDGKRVDGGLPYQRTDVGFMVWTAVTIAEQTQECYLPVMDHRNKAKQAPDILDVNNTLMRCLVKNLALFGLGLHIYAGEDIPFGTDAPTTQIDPETGEIIPQGAQKGAPASSPATFVAALARVAKMTSGELPNAKRMATMLFQGEELTQYQQALGQREKELSAPGTAHPPVTASSPSANGLPL